MDKPYSRAEIFSTTLTDDGNKLLRNRRTGEYMVRMRFFKNAVYTFTSKVQRATLFNRQNVFDLNSLILNSKGCILDDGDYFTKPNIYTGEPVSFEDLEFISLSDLSMYDKLLFENDFQPDYYTFAQQQEIRRLYNKNL